MGVISKKVGVVFGLLLALGVSTGADAASSFNGAKGRILLLVSVDWEGRVIRSENLRAMREFREEFPQLRLMQFLNAAYFTKPNASVERVVEGFHSVVNKDDEIGLHIHGWKSLFESSGVSFRDSPTFWGTPVDCSHDCGHDVPIDAYTTEELRKVIRFSVKTLADAGFGHPKSFRAGGWMASGHVLDALTAEGFQIDSSAVPAKFLARGIGQTNLYRWVENLWRGTTSLSQPAYLRTSNGPILEIPDNGALADYMSASEMVKVFQTAAEKWKKEPDSDVWVQIGFHQETATSYVHRVAEALREIQSLSERQNLPLGYVDLPFRALPLH